MLSATPQDGVFSTEEATESQRRMYASICKLSQGFKLALLDVVTYVVGSAPFLSSLPLHRPTLNLLIHLRYGIDPSLEICQKR